MRRGDGEPGRLAMPRRRGAASGLLIVILGAIGALAPLVGPYFNLTIGPDQAFDLTAGRFWLSVLPGVVTVVGGLMLMLAGNRASAALGAQIAMAGGIWFVVGPTVSMLWNDGAPQTGQPLGGTNRQVLEWLVYFYGIGAAITALSGIAFGRVSARHAGDVERLAPATESDRRAAAYDDQDRARTGRFGRFGRKRAAEPEPERDREPVATERSAPPRA